MIYTDAGLHGRITGPSGRVGWGYLSGLEKALRCLIMVLGDLMWKLDSPLLPIEISVASGDLDLDLDPPAA